MPNPGISRETLAEIQGRLLAGAKPSEIAAELNVSHSTISRAKAKISSELLAQMNQEQAEVITDLVMQQLETGLEATITIAQQVNNVNWINGQDAGKLAVLYGVVSDKSIRLLEASENAAEANRRARVEGSTELQSEFTQ